MKKIFIAAAILLFFAGTVSADEIYYEAPDGTGFWAEQTTTTFKYDSKGNLIQEKTSYGHESSYEISYKYDSKGNKIYMKSNKFGIKSEVFYEYDSRGNLVLEKTADGHETVYEYDSTGRLIKKTEAQSETIYIYDSEGKLSSKQDDSSVRTYKYDSKGRIIYEKLKTEMGETSEVITEYNSTGRKVDYKYWPGEDYYGFSKDFYFENIEEYDSNGNLVYEKTDMGIECYYEYDSSGNEIHCTNTAGYISWKEYVYDTDGRIIKITEYYKPQKGQ